MPVCGKKAPSLPYREDWRREEARDAGDSFYILIKTDD